MLYLARNGRFATCWIVNAQNMAIPEEQQQGRGPQAQAGHGPQTGRTDGGSRCQPLDYPSSDPAAGPKPSHQPPPRPNTLRAKNCSSMGTKATL